ncbi:MAG: helix-turn-helix transcriptional regulator [Proteobacteria bacterium]|nr:helix-turn-helix transcriptional regulator [Pseudomonadota bacterium]
MNPELIDRIYECAFAPEGWPAVLDEISIVAEARGGSLFTANQAVLNWTSSRSMADVWDALMTRGLMACGDRFRRLVEVRHSGFVTELDGYSGEDEMAGDPLYNEVLWPMGLGWAAATALPLPTGDTLIFTFERERASGPAGPDVLRTLDSLRPHLARSALLSARLQLDRARALGETLELLGLPALVFDATGRLLAANALAEGLAGVQWRARDRISLADPAADGLFQQALQALERPDGVARLEQVRSFAVRGGEAGPSLVAHVAPILGAARSVFARCAGVLVLTPVTLPAAPPVELVQSLFDLTPAEARVARRLAAGETVDEIAADSGLAPITVRNQVRAILRKTGCRRQAEVVALLGGLSGGR